MDHHYHIKFENVYIRPLVEVDIESLRNWRNDANNTMYLNNISYITPQMQNDWFQRYLQNNDEMFFAIVENQDLNRLVGSFSLYNFTDETCLFGKILIGDREAHGRKVGLNATIAATNIAFNLLKLKKVNLYVYIDNLAALKIYQKAGFVISDEHRTATGRNEYTMTRIREVD